MQSKKSIFILIFFVYLNTNAQETKTLLDTTNWKNVGFMALSGFNYSKIDKSNAVLIHLRSGIVIKDKITIGGFLNTSVNDIIPKSETIPGIYLDYKTYGFFCEYTIFSNNLVHATFPVLIGGGELEMNEYEADLNLGEVHFFNVEPGVFLELNIYKYIRFNVGFTYRFIGNVNYRNMNQSNISGFSGQIGLKFGVFNW